MTSDYQAGEDEPLRRRGDRRQQTIPVIEDRRRGDRRSKPGIEALLRTLLEQR